MHTIIYNFADGFLEKRAPHRSVHLDYLRGFETSGKIAAGGALTNVSDAGMRGLILFRGDATEALQLVQNDPYFKADLIQSYEVHDWVIVLGDKADLLK